MKYIDGDYRNISSASGRTGGLINFTENDEELDNIAGAKIGGQATIHDTLYSTT